MWIGLRGGIQIVDQSELQAIAQTIPIGIKQQGGRRRGIGFIAVTQSIAIRVAIGRIRFASIHQPVVVRVFKTVGDVVPVRVHEPRVSLTNAILSIVVAILHAVGNAVFVGVLDQGVGAGREGCNVRRPHFHGVGQTIAVRIRYPGIGPIRNLLAIVGGPS